MRRACFVIGLATLGVAQAVWANVPGPADVINSGTTQWFQAAETGRADMLVIGDSTVLHTNYGWSGGLNDALQNTVGLAGTGLIAPVNSGASGSNYNITPSYPSQFTTDTSSVPTAQQGYIWGGSAFSAGNTAVGDLLAGMTLPQGASDPNGYDWDIYSVPTSGSVSGSYQTYSRDGVSPYTVLTPSNTTHLVTVPASGLQEQIVHFDRPAGATSSMELHMTQVQNTSVLYSRAVIPGATGATVTSWGLGGYSMLGFYNNAWAGQGVTTAGRTAWLNALTEGGSGKLNVLITEGFNDRNESSPSLTQGITPGNSAAAFKDNVMTQINAIRSAWTAAGRSATDLSFTLVSDYEDTYEAQSDATLGANAPLHQYASVEAQIAAADPQISFVDMLNHAPSYADAVADGYMYDDVHFNNTGAQVYSQDVINALLPEPGSISIFGISMAALLRLRRR